MSANRRIWLAGAAALLLVLLPFGNFVKTNYGDGAFISVNFARFFLQTVSVVIAVVAALAGLLHFCTSKRVPDALSRAILTAGGAFFLLFFYRHPYLRLFPENVADWIPASSFLVVVALFATILFVLAKHAAITVAALIYAIANTALTLPSVTRTAVEATEAAFFEGTEPDSSRVVNAGPRPNVYYFILDAYGSTSSIRENLGYDNGPFIEAMERRGFYHAENAISSYNRTVFTLAAIFAQDYFATGEMTLSEGSRRRLTYPALLIAPDQPNLVADAKSQGYEFYLVGNYWAQCGGPWVSCYAEAEGSAYLADVFWSATPNVDLVARAWAGDTERAPDVDAIGKLRMRLEKSGAPKTPTFTFIHHLSPHAPYLFHADCSRRENYELDLDNWPDAAKPYFLDNLKCANLNAARIADDIVALDPDAIIVFQGDHGTSFTVDWGKPFDEWLPEWVHERSSMLNLVKLPEACQAWLAPDLDNVTTIRAVMGCVSGREPTENNPRGYLTTFEKENPDHGQVRRIDPKTLRPLPLAAHD